ncbi:MAG: hypothetical protein JSV22_07305 [Bacteroidales bacterium]|nr:MAG: hypothetical protein JSV22_07305 [Bacteroidales bacterium]
MNNIKFKYVTFLLLFVLFIVGSCEKDSKNEQEIKGDVYFYLLKSYKTRDNSSEIIVRTAQIADKPLIDYKDIISYNSDLSVYNISKKAREKILGLITEVSGPAFAVTIDEKIIYAGYFWPATSSVSCDWTSIDPLFVDFWDGLKVMPGNNWDKPNPGNDSSLIEIFKRDKKLVN